MARVSSCLTENTVVDALQGGLAARAQLEAHLDQCDRCRRLVEMLTTGMGGDTAAAGSTEGSVPDEARLPSRLPEPGTCVGRYRIQRLIGAGGMGVVYSARDPELDRDVAIKLIRPELGAASGTVEQRLVRESRAMAQLAHPNVLAVHDVGRFEGQVFIAMELAAGGTLSEWLAAERRGWREIVERFCLAGRGLRAAHETGLVHRDFKPENVLLTADGGVRVADFGLVWSGEMREDAAPIDTSGAEPIGFMTRTGARLGTPLYMAPEQHEGGKVGPAADQFAFAVALHDALYRVHPFAASTYPELVRAIKSGRVRDVPGSSEVPSGLRDVVLRALRVEPEDRWPSMGAMLDALERQVAAGARVVEPSDPQAREQSAGLRGRLDQARALGQAGKYAEALPLVRAIVAEAAALGHGPILAEAMYRQGTIEVDSGDARAGERSLSEAAVAAARAHDDGLAALIWSDMLVVVGHREGRSSEAQLLRPAAEAALARAGDDPLVQARFLNSLGIVMWDHGRLADARESFERAAVLYRDALGPGDPEVAKVHNNLGCMLTTLGVYDEAREHHELARTIWERTLGPQHPHSAFCLNNMGELACEEGRHDEAAALHLRALAIREAALRPDHPHVALSLHNLGLVRHRQGRHGEARELHERALAMRLAILGGDHPDTAGSLSGLGAALVALGNVDEGCEHHERALAIAVKALGPDHVRIAGFASDLGQALGAQGHFEQAAAQHERALAIAERALGPAHPQVARIRDLLDRSRGKAPS